MRRLLALVLLAPTGTPQDPPAHDPLGFPITFNDEVITKSDVLRYIGLEENQVENLRPERDAVLIDKLLQRVGQLHGLVIEEANVDAFLRRHVDLRGGEALFYEYLAQRGQTLERYREGLRLDILKHQLDFMVRRGYSPDRRHFLPWNPVPTPREVAVAFASDPKRHEASARVRYRKCEVDIDAKTRNRLSGQVMQGKLKQEDVEGQVRELLRPRVEAILAAVAEGKPFDEAAASQGAAAVEEARKLPQTPENDAERFLAGAKAGDTSGPIPQGGAVLLLHVLEVDRPQDMGVDSPEVLREYQQRIHELRRRKAEALLRLEALASCTVRPERVRTELREVLLASLRDAQGGLGELGLH